MTREERLDAAVRAVRKTPWGLMFVHWAKWALGAKVPKTKMFKVMQTDWAETVAEIRATFNNG